MLEALNGLEAKWREIYRATQSDDEKAEYGNDLVEPNMTRKQIAESAVQKFWVLRYKFRPHGCIESGELSGLGTHAASVAL